MKIKSIAIYHVCFAENNNIANIESDGIVDRIDNNIDTKVRRARIENNAILVRQKAYSVDRVPNIG